MKDCVLRTNNIAKFSWKTAYKQLEANCPLTMEFLNSVAGPSKQKQLPRVMSSMGILLFNRNLKMGTLQAINSIMMFRGHIRTKVYSTFNRAGLCSSYQTTVRHLDKICEGFDLPVRKWSESLSSKHSNMDRVDVTDEHNYALPQISKVPVDESADIKIEEEIPVALIPLDHNMSVSSDSSQYLYTAELLEDEDPACNSFNSPVQHLQQMTSVESPYTTVNTKMNNDAPTYQIIMDNLNMNTKARHKTEDTSNKIFNLTHSVAVKDRVSSEDLDSCHPQADILSIPNEAFIPKEEDYVALYSDYKVLVQRVLVEFVPAFSDYRDLVIGHILHQYSHESSKKSNVVPLGILEKDENKTEEMIQIIEHLQKYVPRDAKGHMIPIPLGGDALSVERGEAAQKARSDGVTEDDRLEGFIWKSEDWHGHVISLQEAYNRHFKGSSSGERGTLFQLRNRFDHRGVKSTVKDAVNECREFLRFVTKGYIVLAALEILNVNQIDHIQINDNKTNEEKKEFIDQLAGDIIQKFVAVSSFQLGQQGQNQDENNNRVSCGYPGCPKTFARNGKVREKHRGLCMYKDMRCLQMPEHNKKMFTTVPSETTESKEDSKFNYSCSLLREGLEDWNREDAARENDGDRLIRMWRFDFLKYSLTNHTKYRLLAFRLQAQLLALLPPKLAHQIRHNRCINFHGGKGCNVPGDLALEFLNMRAKDSLNSLHGNLSSSSIQRCGRSLQGCNDLIIAYSEGLEQYFGKPSNSKPSIKKDVHSLVEELGKEDLFKYIPGRSHRSFPQMSSNPILKLNGQKLNCWITDKKEAFAKHQRERSYRV